MSAVEMSRTDNGRKPRGGRFLSGRPVFALLFLVLIIAISSGCGRKVYSNSGSGETELLARLGVYPDAAAEKVNDGIDRFNSVLALQKLLGAGDETRAADYFRSISYTGSVDFFIDADGTRAEPGDGLSASQAYGMCLKALGYIDGQIEQGQSVDSIAAAAGFGTVNGSGLLTGDKMTYGSFAIILHELMFLKPRGAGDAVYRVTALMDKKFSDLLEYNGLYDDVPAELCPVFKKGYYSEGSFYAAVASEKREWGASYVSVSETDLSDYMLLLESDGWIREGKYSSETEAGTAIILYYKAEASAPDGEMGLVLKYNAAGTLRWVLMA